MSLEHPSLRALSRPGIALLLCAASAGAVAQAPARDLEAGRQLYMSNGCFACHGTVGQGSERGGAPKLAPDPQPYEAFRVMVRHPREAMPRLDTRFVSDEQLLAIHRYLASIPKGPAAKDISQLQPPAR